MAALVRLGNAGEPKDDDSTKQEVGTGSLVRLKHTYKFIYEFGESYGEWLDAIEAKSNEVLGNFMKEEDEALTTFGARWKRAELHIRRHQFLLPSLPSTSTGWKEKKRKATRNSHADTQKQKGQKLS
jgi:hypothetical protein